MQTESTTSVAADEPVAAFTEGVKMLKNGYSKKAVACFKRALECDKQNPYYLSFLGVSMAQGERNLTEAVKLCEAAIQKKLPGPLRWPPSRCPELLQEPRYVPPCDEPGLCP